MHNIILYQSKEKIITLDKEQQVIYKILQQRYISAEDTQKFKNEYNILQNTDIQGVRKVLAYEEHEENPQITLEYIEGSNLRDFFRENKLSISEKILIFKDITYILSQIHQAGIIHKDLNPANILITEGKEVCFIDFGISSRFTLKQPNLGNPEKLEGTLNYISPEQTGRMNRSVDYRTDLYSLGATFYELLLGSPPFQEKEVMDLVHAHLAKSPENPKIINSEIPEVIGNIVMKLLAKNPEDRYQSALGVVNDIDKYLTFTKYGKSLPNFELGLEDFSGKLQIPEKLYGREAETKTILEAFERVKAGTVELTMVAGYSGTGKSVLVHETHRPLTSTKGYFIEGKFDQFQKNIPFSAWIQAFKSFVDLLLTENEERLQYWKSTILKALGENGAVLTEVIPNLELIIGKQENIVELGGQEAQNRFNYVMQSFVKAITTKEHPLIIFIDDLQWADLSSLSLLKTLVTDHENTHLLCVGAYRDNEVSSTHLLNTTLKEIQEETHNVNTLKIDNLSQEAVLEMLSETLDLPKDEKLEVLGQNILSKTQGNAFFTHQFLKSLYEEELLKFDLKQKRWVWDNVKIQAANFTDNVIEFMAKKVENLPKNAQKLLELASCIGNKFDLETLKIIAENEDIQADLEKAILEGLVFPLRSKQYKFAHDRIQQATYSLIPDTEKQRIHLKIGQLLYTSLSEEKRKESIFDIAGHFIQSFTEQKTEERFITGEVCLLAAQRARASVAYDSALNYINIAEKTITKDGWEKNYSMTLTIFEELATIEIISGNFERANKYADIILENAKSRKDKIRTYFNKFKINNLTNKMSESIVSAETFFKDFDIYFPASNRNELQKIIQNKRQQIDQILSYPERFDENIAKGLNTDAKQMNIIKLLTFLWSDAFYVADWEVAGFATLSSVLLALENKETEDTAFAWGCHSVNLLLEGNLEEAVKVAEHAMNVNTKFGGEDTIGMVNNLLAHSLTFYSHPFKHNIQLYQRAYIANMRVGNSIFSNWSLAGVVLTKLFISTPLTEVEEDNEECLAFAKKSNEVFSLYWAVMRAQTLKALQGKTRSLDSFNDEEFNIEKWLGEVEDMQAFALHNWYYGMQGMLYLLNENYEKVIEIAQKSRETATYNSGFFWGEEYAFYEALSAMQLGIEDEYRENIEKTLEKYKQIADIRAENFLHKYQLLKAEKARTEEKPFGEVLRLYREAISHAKANGFSQNAALANEFCAKFLIKQEMSEYALPHIKEAYQLYKQWGATAKIAQLKEKYAGFFRSSSRDITKTIAQSTYVGNTLSSTSISTTKRGLDLDTILKANATLSQQVRLKDLIEEMLELLSKNSGANKIAFLRKEADFWWVEADSEDNKNLIVEHQSFEEYANLPKQIITYVMRSKEFILLDDVSQNQQFYKDPYFQKHSGKSVFVLPVQKQAEVLAILYLENNLNTGVFHKKRYELINALVTQLAISMENTLLYENLEGKVHERTLELQEAYEETQVMNEELRQTQEELEAQRDFVEEQNKELNKSNQKLASSEQILKKTNDKIQEKNKDLEFFNQKINNSIKSAKTIQEALLPTQEKLSRTLGEYFLIYRPKDVVSGDFYWLTTEGNKTYLAVADCTGHGVPGAFMANMGITFLYSIIRQKKLEDPAEILKLLHREVSVSLKQAKTGNNNGMDIALLSMEKLDNNTTKVAFCGAKRPLYYIENGQKELKELKETRKSIGGIQNKERKFKTQEIILSKGSLLYLGSDGLEDQNNTKRKKFGRKLLKSILEENSQQSLRQQKEVIENTLENHMQEVLQRDDILWMGVRL